MKKEINGYKSNKMPKAFFTEYPNHLKDYDFLPSQSLDDEIWLPEKALEFIKARREDDLFISRETRELEELRELGSEE